MGKIVDHKYKIEEAFRQCFYIVPDYQREYVWTEKQVTQLLEDVDEQVNGSLNSEYFMGTVLVAPATKKVQPTSTSSTGSSALRRFF